MDKFIFCCVFAVIFIEAVWCKKHGLRVKNINDIDVKIVGGISTTIQEYPYQAYLLVYDGRDYYQCGGTIISRYHIVTAAHCLTRMQRIYVRIGSTNSDSGGNQYETTTYYSHPRYNSRTNDYDAGVVKIREGMNLDGTNATAINMVNTGNDPPDGENMILTGWGTTAQNGNVSTTLMVVQVPVLSRTRCNALLNSSITSRMICAGVPQGGKDTCQGDSGGPAVISITGRLAGITSFGFGCAQPNSPGVYTRIGNMEIRLFIKTITGL